MATNGEVEVWRLRLAGRTNRLAAHSSWPSHTHRSWQQDARQFIRSADQRVVKDSHRYQQSGDSYRRRPAQAVYLRARLGAAGRSRSGHQTDPKLRDEKIV